MATTDYERHMLHARLRDAHRAMELLLRDVKWGDYDRCGCGHRYVEHKRVVSPNAVHDACAVQGCLCIEFEDRHV